jgi:hypothetical protein
MREDHQIFARIRTLPPEAVSKHGQLALRFLPACFGPDHIPVLLKHAVPDAHEVDHDDCGTVRVGIAATNHYMVAFSHHDAVLPFGAGGQGSHQVEQAISARACPGFRQTAATVTLIAPGSCASLVTRLPQVATCRGNALKCFCTYSVAMPIGIIAATGTQSLIRLFQPQDPPESPTKVLQGRFRCAVI